MDEAGSSSNGMKVSNGKSRLIIIKEIFMT